jgi:ABC-type transport system substrate-binding protein
LKAARAELDEKKRRKMYVEMQQPAVILQAAAF